MVGHWRGTGCRGKRRHLELEVFHKLGLGAEIMEDEESSFILMETEPHVGRDDRSKDELNADQADRSLIEPTLMTAQGRAWVVVGGGRVAGLARAAHTSPIIIYT